MLYTNFINPSEEKKMNIQETLKHYREKAGLTQEEVANQLFVNRSTYTNYETGKRKMDVETFLKIIDILGIDISLKEKKHMEWSLYCTSIEEEEEKIPLILTIYEENGLYDIEAYESIDGEKEELILANSAHFPQGERTDKETIDWIIKNEIQSISTYYIEKIEYLTFDDVEADPSFFQEQTNIHMLSVSMINRMIRKLLFDKYGRHFTYHFSFDPEWVSPECSFGEDEDTQFILKSLFLEYEPHAEQNILQQATKYGDELLSDSFEQIEEKVKFLSNERIHPKKSTETDDQFQARIKKELTNIYYQSFYETQFEEFLDSLTDLLLEQIIGKPIRKYQRDNEYWDIITIRTY